MLALGGLGLAGVWGAGALMAEVHVLPGIEAGVTNVIIVGRDRAGELYVASANGDADRDVGMLMRAVSHIAGATIVNDVVIETEPPAG